MAKKIILIKPASSICNMVCTYCFYDDVSDCREVKSHGTMKEKTWKKLIDDAFSLEGFDEISFAFQGGEPLMAGKRYFELFVAYAGSKKKHRLVEYSIQTNGTMLTADLCKFFKKHNFLVGISIDGFKENHDKHRTFRGVGAFDEVYRGLKLLQEFEIPFNVLTVLTKNLAKYPEKLYEFYQNENINYVQIIPCMPSFSNTVEEDFFACTPDDFESFYKGLYKAWKEELASGQYRSILLFNDIVSVFSGQYPSQCGFLGNCVSQTVVEANGSIYPCDFYVLDEFEAGTLDSKSLQEISQSDTMTTFVNFHPKPLALPCNTCPFKQICNGGCKRLRDTFLGDEKCGLKAIYETVYHDYQSVMSLLQYAKMEESGYDHN